jgi:hypothetical protein
MWVADAEFIKDGPYADTFMMKDYADPVGTVYLAVTRQVLNQLVVVQGYSGSFIARYNIRDAPPPSGEFKMIPLS